MLTVLGNVETFKDRLEQSQKEVHDLHITLITNGQFEDNFSIEKAKIGAWNPRLYKAFH